MKIALVGSNGLLGSSIKYHLKKLNIESLFLTRDIFEITNCEDYKLISNFGADIVINTAAFLGVEPCEDNPTEAFIINTQAVGNLARFCHSNNITLAQISTDSVFDGKKGNYNEKSTPNPVNLYGLTKYGGEQLAKNICDNHYIFRIPILFGKRENQGNIFIEKMYTLYKNGKKELQIADDIICTPSYSFDIANKIVDLIINKHEYGIYHLFNNGKDTSLYDFAVEFFKQKNITDITVNRAKASDFSANEKGKKQLNTTLSSHKILPMREWEDAMYEYINL